MQLTPDYNLQQYMASREEVYFFYEVKNEHYQLLSNIVREYNDCVIYDIGTYNGLSAVALSTNQTNRVISYDIEYLLSPPRGKRPHNVEYRIGDIFNDIENVVKSPLIFMDVDPHDGVFEHRFYKELVDRNYVGTLWLDDIHLNPKMEEFWNSITQEKHDFTEYGHYSGTGKVIFK